jgi:dCMP deaminase
MFIAIIGTRFSGRTTIESYLVERGFIPVRVIAQALDYEARVGDYGEVSPSDQPHSFVDVDDGDFDATSNADTHSRGHLSVSTGTKNRLSTNSFLSLDSTAPSPVSIGGFQRQPASEQPLWFASTREVLEHVTLNWRSNFVTRDLRTERMIQMFIKRPFFMLVSVDGPISDRFRRANKFVLCSSFDLFFTHVSSEVIRQGLSALL